MRITTFPPPSDLPISPTTHHFLGTKPILNPISTNAFAFFDLRLAISFFGFPSGLIG